MRSEDDSTSSQQMTPRPPQVGDETRPVPLCKFDEHMMSLIPTYKPVDEPQLTDFLLMRGATKDTLDGYLQGYNRMTEKTIQTAGVKVIGVRAFPVVGSLVLSQRIHRTCSVGQASPRRPECLQRPHPRLPIYPPHVGRRHGPVRLLLPRLLR